MSSLVVTREINYDQHNIAHGTYQLTKLYQQSTSTGQTVTLTTSGGAEAIFELPGSKAYNFGKSVLQFTKSYPSAGANNFNVNFMDCANEFRQLQLYTRTGLYLCDLNYVGNYTNMVCKHETKADEMREYDNASSGGSGASHGLGKFEGLQMCNVSAAGTGVATANSCNVRPAGLPAGTNNGANVAPAASVSDINYIEPTYCLSGLVSSVTPVFDIAYPLKYFKNTILALDRDIYFEETVYLRIVFDDIRKMGFQTTANYAAPTALTVTPTITNLQLMVAVETNPVILNTLKSKVDSGTFEMLIPFIYSQKIAQTGSSQTVMTRYNKAHGSKLLKIYWAPFNATEIGNTAYDHSNRGTVSGAAGAYTPGTGGYISQFYTTINNTRTTQYNYDCTVGDDYVAQKDYLRGSCIMTSDEYYYNWTWIERFTNNYDLLTEDRDTFDNGYIDGLDLTNTEQLYNIYVTVNPNLVALRPDINTWNHYVYAVTQKKLRIAPGTISLDAESV